MKIHVIMFSIIILIMLTLNVYGVENNIDIIFEKENKYSDLYEKHWAYEAICDMTDRKILEGLPDGRFGVNEPITREAFATILVRAFELKQSDSDNETFIDVKNTKWSFKYVETVKKYIFGSYINNEFYFKPSNSILREDAIVALCLLLGIDDTEIDLSVLESFDDSCLISQDKKGFVAAAVENRLISGDGKNINPKGVMTRAEASYLIYKILNSEYKVSDELDKDLGTKLCIYNDGYVRFTYPIQFRDRLTKDTVETNEHENYKSFSLTKDNMKINLYYTLDPLSTTYEESRGIGTSTVSGILKYLNKSEFKKFEKENYNNNYIKMKYTSEYGNRIHIYGRGIDNIIPQLVIMGKEKYDNENNLLIKTEDEIFHEDREINNIANVIRESFLVVSNIKAFKSPGNDKTVMETYPKDGMIDVDTNLTCEIKCNAEIGWGAKYSFQDETGVEIRDIEVYYSTNRNVLKIRFGSELESQKTYRLVPEILNDAEGNFINGGEIVFTTK